MIGICIPAHNEQSTIVSCLEHALLAGRNPRLANEPTLVVVVADACTDDTMRLASMPGVVVLQIDARNVGAARATGAQYLVDQGATWLAFTDADTLVSEDWLAEQIALGADAVCGTVGVHDWTPHGEHAQLLQTHFAETYFDVEAHSHVHGANFGVSTQAYLRVGGFRQLACSEDVELVRALENAGARIAWSARPRVVTSARQAARAPGGFADALLAAVSRRLSVHTADALPVLLPAVHGHAGGG